MKIQKLSESKIRQIAAGEVITRPSSAIKELIENSLDAEASSISIHLHNSGLDKIIVIDNGTGIDKEDLAIASMLHTTSKTHEEDQIYGANSFGFRGEALSAIDAISNLSIESNGFCFSDGNISCSNISHGTRIKIENLFHNVPARLKFMKKNNIELENIKEIIKKYAISNPQIKFEVYHNDRQIFKYDSTSHINRLETIFKEEPIFFQAFGDQIRISGYIFKKHKNYSAIFVNKRPVKDKAIKFYISNLCKEYFMKHEEPSYVLYIEIDPMMIDCNAHPSKDEIRFVSYEPIYKILFNIFNLNLFEKFYESPISGNTLTESSDISENIDTPLSGKINDIIQPLILATHKGKNFQQPKAKKIEILNFDKIEQINEPVLFKEDITQRIFFNIVGQIKNSYIIFETENGIGVFDQHAAHERKLYEMMKHNLNQDSAQKLLIPIELNISLEKTEFLASKKNVFAEKGIIIEGKTLTHIPNLLNWQDFKMFLEQEIQLNSEPAVIIDRLFADIACKNALKANTKLSLDQMYALLSDALINPPVCNHGRPVFKYFTINEINSWFKR